MLEIKIKSVHLKRNASYLFVVEKAAVALICVEVEEEGEVHLDHAVEVLGLGHLNGLVLLNELFIMILFYG